MNCPGHMLLFGSAAAQLPRAAAALRRVGAAAPQRADRDAARAAARPARHPGRRAHLLHARADRGRDLRRASTTPRTSTTCSGSTPRFELSTRPENKLGTDEEWDFTEAALARRARAARARRTTINAGDGAFYGPKIDLHMTDVARPLLADGDDPARLPDAGALRPHLHGRRQRRAPRRRRPPRAARLARALHRDPDRALRRRVPGLARAGAGARAAGRRDAPRRPRDELLGGARAAGSGPRSTSATRRSASGSATPSCEKIPYVVVWGDRETREAMAVRERGGEGVATMSLDGLVDEIAAASPTV